MPQPQSNLITALLILLGLAAVDWVLGVLKAVIAGTFSLSELPKQLENTILPYVGSYVAILIPAALQPDGTFSSTALTTAAVAVATTASAKLIGDIVSKALGLGSSPAKSPPATGK